MVSGTLTFTQAQSITTTGYDIHNRALSSTILNYSDSLMTGSADAQVITYSSYDKFGNAVSESIDTYSTSTLDPASLVNHKTVVNTYDNVTAERRGNATTSTVTRYSDLLAQNMIDQTVTSTTSFDLLGNALTQVQTTEQSRRLFSTEPGA